MRVFCVRPQLAVLDVSVSIQLYSHHDPPHQALCHSATFPTLGRYPHRNGVMIVTGIHDPSYCQLLGIVHALMLAPFALPCLTPAAAWRRMR